MTVDLDMINVHLNGEKFVRRLLTAKRSRDAVMRYAALIAYLSEVRAMGRGASKPDAEVLGYNVARVERFESPLRLANLAALSQATGIRMSDLLDRAEVGHMGPITPESFKSRLPVDLDVASARIQNAALMRMKTLGLSIASLSTFTGLDRDLVYRMFRAPGSNPIREEGEQRRHKCGIPVGCSSGPHRRPVLQLDCMLLPLGLDLAAVLRTPFHGELPVADGCTNDL